MRWVCFVLRPKEQSWNTIERLITPLWLNLTGEAPASKFSFVRAFNTAFALPLAIFLSSGEQVRGNKQRCWGSWFSENSCGWRYQRAMPSLSASTITEEMDVVNCNFQEVIRFPHTMSARVTAVITCIISALGLITAVSCNTLFILAFARTRELRTFANLFLVSLSCTDLLVGSVVEPLYITRQSLALSGIDDCGVWIAYLTMALFCTGASFLNLTLISCERYVAIFSPLNYMRLVTRSRVLSIIGGVWLAWVTLTCVRFAGIPNRIVYLICFAVIGSCYAVTAFVYFFIFREARRHHRRIVAEQQSYDPLAPSVARETKLAKTMAYIFGALLICYTPGMVILLTRTIKGDTPELLYTFYPWAENLIFLNSSLNPMIYCWRNREIRRAVFRVINPLTSLICKGRVGSSVNMGYVPEARSKTPKTECGTFVTMQNSPEIPKDIEVLSICSKE